MLKVKTYNNVFEMYLDENFKFRLLDCLIKIENLYHDGFQDITAAFQKGRGVFSVKRTLYETSSKLST